MFGLHGADLLAILLYLVVVVGIGLYTSRMVSGLSSFVMPRRFGELTMIMFSFGSGTSSDQAVSVASRSFTNGLSGMWYQWLYLFGTPFYWLIAPVMRLFRATSAALVPGNVSRDSGPITHGNDGLCGWVTVRCPDSGWDVDADSTANIR